MNENMMISGKWINKNNGIIINVRNSVIDVDEMILVTDHGTISMTEFTNNYIQASDEVYDMNGNVVSSSPVEFGEILQPKKTDYEEYGFSLDKPLVSNNVTVAVKPVESTKESNLSNYDLINKLFIKTKFEPKITINIDSNNFPKEQIKMLMDIYDISLDDISNYINKNYLTSEIINNSLSAFIEKNI